MEYLDDHARMYELGEAGGWEEANQVFSGEMRHLGQAGRLW